MLGEKYPPVSGWKKRLLGKVISKEDAKLFIELKGKKPKEQKKLLKEKDGICGKQELQKSNCGYSWNTCDVKPNDKENVLFVTSKNYKIVGYYDAAYDFFVYERSDSKVYTFKPEYVKYWFSIPAFPDDTI